MAVISFSREASKEEMGREIDRRGAVIDALTEERDRLKRERDEWQDKYDKYGIRFEKYICEKAGYTFYPDGRISSVMFVDRLVAERDRLALANAELKPLLQNIGDGIANMFDQLVKGNWRDDHDHDVKMNVHMLNLHDVLKQIMRFRADYLDYSEPNFDKHKATSTEREGE